MTKEAVNIDQLRAWADHPAANHMVPVHPDTLRAVADEIERLRSFIELCRDTFADFQVANRILGRTLQADAARAGYDACVKCLAGETFPQHGEKE